MFVIRITLVVLFICQNLGIGSEYCLSQYDHWKFCADNVGRISADVFYICAYDSNERQMRVLEVFDVIQDSVSKLLEKIQGYGQVEVWPGRTATLKTWVGNESSTKELDAPKDVDHSLKHAIHIRRRQSLHNIRFVIIVIEFVTHSCPNIDACRKRMDTLCRKSAKVLLLYISLSGITTVMPSASITNTNSSADEERKLYEHFSNCICRHMVLPLASQFCVPITMVSGWPPSIIAPVFIRKTTLKQTDVQESRQTYIILMSVGIVLMVVSCIVAVIGFRKFLQAHDTKTAEAASENSMKVSSASPAPVSGQVPMKKSEGNLKSSKVRSTEKISGCETMSTSVSLKSTESSISLAV